MCGFARMHLYVSAQNSGAGPVAAQALVDLMRTIGSTTENLGGVCFGIGSALFFYLFFKSRYIPRFLSGLGVCASVIWTGLYLANLIFPEDHALFRYIFFPPMAIADIATGFYLMLFGRAQRTSSVIRQQTVPGSRQSQNSSYQSQIVKNSVGRESMHHLHFGQARAHECQPGTGSRCRSRSNNSCLPTIWE